MNSASQQAAADRTIIAEAPASESSQPVNLGQLKMALDRYYTSGTYMHDVAAVDAEARDWVLSQAPVVSHPAMVLDIDETALSNWPEMRANDYGFIPGGSCDALPHGPCGFTGWEQRADAAALAPTLALVRSAQAAHVAIFFITGRGIDLTEATRQNLYNAGYRDWKGLVLKSPGHQYGSAADFKAPVRASIEAKNYTIVATIGDQYSDLDGGHAMRGFKLPNPFYYLP